VLLREEEKEAVVEAGRGKVTFRNGLKNFQENRSRKIRGSPPSSERDAVRPGGGVVATINDGTNKVEVRFSAKGVVKPLIITSQKLHPLTFSNGGGLVPNLGPVNFGKGGPLFARKSGNITRRKPEGRNLSPCLRNHLS
jgi:hypothetical protein